MKEYVFRSSPRTLSSNKLKPYWLIRRLRKRQHSQQRSEMLKSYHKLFFTITSALLIISGCGGGGSSSSSGGGGGSSTSSGSGGDASIPTAPSSFKAIGSNLSWSTASGATYYEIINNNAVIAGADKSITDVTFSVAANGNYSVVACNNSGCSAPTAAINVTMGTVTTLAGSATPPVINGLGSSASFNRPASVAIDPSGNVYVADTRNHLIRKISPQGVVSTLAGSIKSGTSDGTGSAASFYGPNAIALDSTGNVYVSDYGNNKIRKITSLGVVTTFAGPGIPGSTETFYPTGIAVDAAGNVYVADYFSKIRKITPTGQITTLAGSGSRGSVDGNGTNASFWFPGNIAIDSGDNLYVADGWDGSIRKITPQGTVTTFADGSAIGKVGAIGSKLVFALPNGVAVDIDGNVFVTNDNIVIKFTPEGTGSLLAGGAGSFVGTRITVTGQGSADGIGSAATFNRPNGVAVDSTGVVYLADTDNNLIRRITKDGTVSTFAGSTSSNASDGVGASARFNDPKGLAIDSSDNIYVVDGGNHSIRKVTPQGAVTTFAGTGFPGSSDGSASTASFYYPSEVAVDKDGNVYVADAGNKGIRKISQGMVTTLASATKSGIAATLKGNVFGMVVDSSGNVYVAKDYVIRKTTPYGTVTTIAGTGSRGFDDGTGSAASFNFFGTTGIAMDKNGNILVADSYNNAIRKITPQGVVTTIAGGTQGSIDGFGSNASFNFPTGIAIDSTGNIYIVDASNNVIRKIGQ